MSDKVLAPAALYEMHMHTPLCKHATGDPEDYAAVAERRGLSGLVVTCHNPMPDGYSAAARMTADQFDDYLALIERARSAWAGRIDIRVGLECDFVPGYERHVEAQLAATELHHVLGSVHPQVGEYRKRFLTGDPLGDQQVYFEHLAQAAESRLFDTLAHPDLIKNSFRESWDESRILPVILRSLDRIARTGVAMELNTSGLNKVIPEMNPFPAMLVAMQERQIPVVVGSDAHVPERAGADWEQAYDLLEAAGYRHVSLFLDRQRQDIPLTAARAALRPTDGSLAS